MNRSYGYANSTRNNNYGWRNSPSLQDQGGDRKVLDLLEKIRNCKPYLQKRLKMIQDSGQTKLLRSEVEDITYWLEIAQEVRADLIYGVEALEVVHEKMMDMIRLHPIERTTSASQLDRLSDDDDDSAPRSPSPVGSSGDFGLGTKIIPLESSQSKNEWERPRSDFAPNNILPGDRGPPDSGFDHGRHDSKFGNNDWSASTGFDYMRRGDTDMRVDPTRFDAFGNMRQTQQQQSQRPREPTRPFEDPRSSSSNSVWVSSNEGSPWDSYRSGQRPPVMHSRDRGDENMRDCDYRGRDLSPDRNRYQSERRSEEERGRQYFRDQDFRELPRGGSREDRSWERSHDGSRERLEWTRPDRPNHYEPFDAASRIYRERDSRDSDPRRRDFSDSDNRDQWSASRASVGVSPFNGGTVPASIGMPLNPAFIMNQPSPAMGVSPRDVGMIPPPHSAHNIGIMNRGMPQAAGIHQNPVNQQRGPIAMGPQSPPPFPNSFAPIAASQRPGLLPTPPRPVTPNFNMPFQAPTGQNNAPRPPAGPNPFDPRANAADSMIADQFRQKAQQHFASKPARPRPPVPPRPAGQAPVAPRPPAPPTGSNSVTNPSLATNQIAADLPSDPRRRSQLQRMQQQMQQKQQQQQQQQTAANLAPGDPRQRRASSPSKEKEKEKTEIQKPGSKDSAASAEVSPRSNKRSGHAERKDSRDARESPKRNILELRKSLSKQGFHKLGTKTKNFEEVEVEPEAEEKDSAKREERDNEKRTDSSPTRIKGSSKDSNRRSERVTRNRERKSSVSTDDEEKETGRRRSARTRRAGDEDIRTKRQSVSEDEDREVKEKGSSKTGSMEDGALPQQKIVTKFRIPKIKRPEPPPSPPRPAPEEDEPEIEPSPPASPPPAESSEPEKETVQVARSTDNTSVSETGKLPVPSNASAEKMVGSTAEISKQPATEKLQSSKETSENLDQGEKAPEKGEDLAASTNTLLRMFMAKSVGLSGDILDQILSNPAAMDKIKSLVKDHVSEIVGKDSAASPARTDSNDRTVERKEPEEEEESIEDSGEVAESPVLPNGDDVPRRGRSLTRKKAHKRRSSLEKLHDALREMNFDAVLPLGPRRAVNVRSQSEETEPPNSVAESIQSVIDNVVGESSAQFVTPKEEQQTTEAETATANHVPVKKVGRGRKRVGAALAKVPKKRGRKPATIVAVTEKDAIAAAAAIPDPEILAQTHGEFVSPNATASESLKKRGRRSLPKPEAPKSPAKVVKPARPLPSADSDVRITRSMLRPAASAEEAESENKSAEVTSSPEQILEEIKVEADAEPETVRPSRPRQYKAKKKAEVTIPSAETAAAAVTATESLVEVKEESMEIENNPYVFVYEEEGCFDPKETLESHDMLLNSDTGASIVVKKVFPDAFDDFLNSLLGKDSTEKQDRNKSSCGTTEALLAECKETLDWMLSVVQFRENNASARSPDVDLSDLELTDMVKIKTSDNFRRIILSSDGEDNYGEDEDEEDEEDEELREQESAATGNEMEQTKEDALRAETAEFLAPASDEDDSKSTSIVPSQESNEQSNDIPSKYDPEDRESELQDEADNNEDRKKNLEGVELYRCANRHCDFSAPNGAVFKDHALNCPHSEDARNLLCFHCERRLKSITSLMEHLKIHGTPRQLCSLCNFRGWFSSELSKHMKNAHKVYNCKVVTEAREGEDPVYIMYPKGIAGKLALPNDLTQNHILYTSKVQFQPNDLDSVPKSSIFTSLAHCGLCDYSTKVRSNIIRHLELHARSEKDGGVTKVPATAPVNPVPCLERKELMFDKMTNWAGSSHANKVGGVSKEDTLKLPKFVVDQFRYVCSVSSCKQVTGQDDILCAHMKALHFKEKYYVCPHCQEEEGTRDDPRNTVLIEKIPHHLKLHGPRLSKCGHCDYIHFSSASMEKHVATKHVEKKPIFYLIRDLDNDGNALVRRSSTDDPAKPNERWRCTLCKAQLICWDEAKSHCSAVHKIDHQFECTACHYGSDSIYAMSTHISTKACKPEKVDPKVMIMFLRIENFEAAESKNEDALNVPIWRRDAPRVKHIRGIFLDDENVRPASSKSSALKTSSASTTPAASTSSSPATTPKPPPPPPLLVCPKCKLFKAKSAKDLKVHLFNEMNYQRYKCTICDIKCVTVESLKAHMNIDHKVVMNVDDEEKALLPVNKKIESEVYDMISKILNAQKTNAEDKDGRNIENLLCKHCYLQFSSFHNYRTHILAKHIGTDRFKCKYCNMGFWHEAMVRKHHVASNHASLPLSVVRDNDFEQMLTPEFWFKEYGIPHHKSVNSVTIGRPEDECGGLSPSKYSEVSLQLQGNSLPGSPTKQTATKKRSMSIASDTDKEEEDPLKLPSSPKKSLKNFKELANYYKCEHCLVSNFTKRGMRSHWSRSHGMEELPCRYYECPSFDANLKLNDGYVLKCSTCPFQTSSIEHYQNHHESEHPGKAFRFKRRKRNELLKSEGASVVVCNHCFCELETVKKCQNHCHQMHPGCPVDYKIESIGASPQRDRGLSGAKLIEDNVIVECPICSKSCGSLKQYYNHFQNYHDSSQHTDPVLRFTRVYGPNEDSDVPEAAEAPRPKIARRILTEVESRGRDSGPPPVPVKKKTVAVVQQPTVLYECPKCDFKSQNMDILCSRHLITHLLAYRCPECDLAFHLFLDAQFHIRHFHGISRVRPSHNGDAYVEFSTLKERITKVEIAPSKNVILVNLSDDEDFDDTPTVYPIPAPGDLDELDVEDVRMLLE